MKVGIVGSSYSVGKHHNYETGHNDLAKPFESWLEKYTNGVDYVNSGCAGKGTELYLNKTVYLKDRHNIDVLLIELVNNRSMLNFKCMPEQYKKIYSLDSISDFETAVYRSSDSIWPYMRAIIQDMEPNTFAPSTKKFDCWKETQWNIASTEGAMEFWGMLDVYQTIKLCNMLGIKCITWAKSWSFSTLPSFDNVIQNATHISFGDFPNAHEYFVDKYGQDNILCDHDHFNDDINEEMIKEYIAPKIMEIKNGQN